MSSATKYGSTKERENDMLADRLHRERKANKKPFSVFVVDDDETFLYALSFHLKKDTHWRVFCYTTAEACLDHLDLEPGAIILDYFFSAGAAKGLDGMAALKLILEQKPGIPVIMLSAQKDLNVSLELLKTGAFTYIVKDREALTAIEKALLAIRPK